MSLSRRGFFRGVFGVGAAAVLAPVAKLMGAKPVLKVRQPGITTAAYQFGFTGWKDLPEAQMPFYGGTEMHIPFQYRDVVKES